MWGMVAIRAVHPGPRPIDLCYELVSGGFRSSNVLRRFANTRSPMKGRRSQTISPRSFSPDCSNLSTGPITNVRPSSSFIQKTFRCMPTRRCRESPRLLPTRALYVWTPSSRQSAVRIPVCVKTSVLRHTPPTRRHIGSGFGLNPGGRLFSGRRQGGEVSAAAALFDRGQGLARSLR